MTVLCPRLAFIFALCLLAACDTPVSEEVLRFGLSAAPRTLDPRYATDAESYRLCRLLYRSLTDFRADYIPAPSLASWQQLAPRHYRFILGDEGRQFHHGGYLDGDDVKATYDSIRIDSGGRLSPHRDSLSGIEDIRVINENTVDFILKSADPLFPGKLNIGILPAELLAAQHSFDSMPIGSGDMRWLGRASEDLLEMTRLSDGQRIHFVVVRDPTVRIMKLLRGELDLLQGNVPPELVRWVAEQGEVRIARASGNYFSYLGFHTTDPVVGDPDLRKGVAHALDRRAIIDHVLQRNATPAESLLPPGHWAAHPDLVPYRYDPARARAYIGRYREKNGLSPDVPIRITYKTSNDPFRLRLATIIQYQLKQVGLQIGIQSYDWGTFYDDIKQGEFQMYSLSWVGQKSPDIFRYAFHSDSMPPVAANRGLLDDPEVDALIEGAEASGELTTQAALYRQLQALLHEQLVYVPLWYESQFAMSRHDVEGYSLHPDGSYDGLAHVYTRRGP